MWDDHDENCHGQCESFEDDPDYAEGFIWECCDKPGDDEGCKTTRHKARINIVAAAPSSVPVLSMKRKAEDNKLNTGSKKRRGM